MSASSEPSPRHDPTGASSSGPESLTLGSAERALLGALAGAPPVDPRRLGLVAGDRLGRYEIVHELGRGGMGVVFLARDTLLDREVALKVLDPSAGSGSDAALRIVREARASSRLAHPSIARVFDVGDDAGLVFLAMEHVPGATLRARIREGRPMEAREVAAIGVAIAQALAVAHRAGIVHRDLKPENVILGDDGRVCVVDFGLAQTSPDRRRLASARAGRPPRPAAGTPGYVAPELAEGAQPDARSDLFSLGVVLRELIASIESTRDAVAIQRVARRLARRDPARRFADGDAVAAVLEPLARPRRSRRRIAGASAVLALGALAVFLVPSTEPSTDRSAKVEGPPDPMERVARALAASPLAVAAPRIACPPFAASGVAPPRVWLGAAAANLACARLAMMLGDPELPPVSPARLLGAPAAPTEADADIDPWSDDAVRETAMARARGDAEVVLDGEVESTRGGFRVSLQLAAVTGAPRGERVSAWHRDLAVAVATALDDGTAGLGAAAPAKLGEAARLRFGVDDRSDLLVLDDLRTTFETYASLDDAWIRAAHHGERGGPLADAYRRRMAKLVAQPPPTGPDRDASERGVDDDTDVASLNARADARATARTEHPPADPRRVADDLGVEASLRARAGDAEASRRLSLAALAMDPESGPWEILVEASYARAGFGSVGRAYATWHPEASDAYNVMSQDARAAAPAMRTRLLERAYLISSAAPLYAGNYGRTLLLDGRREEARAVAARLHTGSVLQGFAGDRLDAEIQLSEGRVAAAFTTLLELLRKIPSVGSVERGDAVALGIAAEVAHLLGREDELAELVIARFVRHPARIDGGGFAATILAQACALARPELARPCIERLAELAASGHFREGATPDGAPFLRGALLWVRGDVKGAAAAFRSIGGRVGFGQRTVVARALDAAGELDAADRLDDPATTRGLFNGVSPSDARAAIRARRRGDPHAAAMARRVLDAWAGADARLAPTTELEAIAR